MKSHNILFALESFFPDSCGGTEHYVLNLAKYLIGQGHTVNIITPNSQSRCYEYEGINIYQYKVLPHSFPEELNGFKPPYGLDEFNAILERLKPDIVHFHSYNRVLNSWHIKAAKQMGTRIVFTTHVAGFFCMRGDLLYKNKIYCDGKIRLHRCMACYIHHKTGNIVLSEIMAAGVNISNLFFPWIRNFKPFVYAVRKKKEDLRLIKKYADKIISISKWMVETYRLNGIVDAIPVSQEVSNMKRTNGIGGQCCDDGKIRLIFVGRLYPIKNIELLLEALSSVDHSKFDLIMAVIPDKKSKGYCDTIRNKYNSLGYKEWHENVTPEKIKELMLSSDLLCLPSRSEVTPIVIKEAFDCGLGVLGSDIPAIKELVTHAKNGILFELNKPESLIKLLERTVSDPDLLASLKSNVCALSDINLTYHKIEKLYFEILNL